MKFYTEEKILDKHIGTKDTAERIAFDLNVDLFRVGEAIREVRHLKKMTQDDLAHLVGVKRSQISKVENGKNLTLTTIGRIFRAMGIKGNLEIELEDDGKLSKLSKLAL